MKEAPKTLLIVDDDASMVAWLEEELGERGYAVHGVTSGGAALLALQNSAYDVVISDVEMPEMRGPVLLAEILARRPAQQVLLMTAFGSIELAVESVRSGASDFIAKPFLIQALVLAVERSIRERHMRKEIVRLRAHLAGRVESGIVAESDAMKRVLIMARKAAAVDLPILITGESGVGKTALARYIHDASARKPGPFVELNCASIPAPLVEAELFGVRRGAYTDAHETRPGLFEEADHGTLFLDELGELGLDVQPKLLRALESGQVREVGGTKEKSVSVRIIAATNLQLEQALRDGRFRTDLYHRVNVLRIDIPPLRDRPEDIDALVDIFLHRASERVGKAPLGITKEALRFLVAQSWPGNVRELANALERAVAMAEHEMLVLDDFVSMMPKATSPLDSAFLDADMTLAQLEAHYLRRVLQRTRGNKTMAAHILGLDRRTVYRKAAELGLGGDDLTE